MFILNALQMYRWHRFCGGFSRCRAYGRSQNGVNANGQMFRKSCKAFSFVKIWFFFHLVLVVFPSKCCSWNSFKNWYKCYWYENELIWECYWYFQGVPILIFANKQDLPGAKEPKELEKLLGLRELSFSVIPPQMIKSSSTLPVSANISSGHKPVETRLNSLDSKSTDVSSNCSSTPPPHTSSSTSSSTSPHHASSTISSTSSSSTSNANSFKGWYIQPACAITGDGLQEGLEALYDMILKKRKLNKAHKKKRCWNAVAPHDTTTTPTRKNVDWLSAIFIYSSNVIR